MTFLYILFIYDHINCKKKSIVNSTSHLDVSAQSIVTDKLVSLLCTKGSPGLQHSFIYYHCGPWQIYIDICVYHIKSFTLHS